MGDSEQLQRLAARTRELAEELDRARPDLLSISELNRALRHILSTQAAILEALAAAPTGAPSQPGASATTTRPHIRVTPSSTAAPGASGPARAGRAAGSGGSGAGKRIELDPSELPDDPILDLEPIEPDEGALGPDGDEGDDDDDGVRELTIPRKPAEPVRELLAEPRSPGATHGQGPVNGNGSLNGATAPASAPAPASASGAQAPEGAAPPSVAEAWLNETRVVPSYLARQLVSQFDNRDKDYDKGLDKLNRWISAGGAGTPFQWRGDQAYLNLNGTVATSARNYEDQLMTRMGFSRRLGRLDVPGLEGEIVIYERPS